MIRGMHCLSMAAFLLAALAGRASGQELTFENLEFEYLHNVELLLKSDLTEKVVMIHFWGTT